MAAAQIGIAFKKVHMLIYPKSSRHFYKPSPKQAEDEIDGGILAPNQAVTASAMYYAFLAHHLSLRSFSVSIQQHTAQSLYLCNFMLTATLQRTVCQKNRKPCYTQFKQDNFPGILPWE